MEEPQLPILSLPGVSPAAWSGAWRKARKGRCRPAARVPPRRLLSRSPPLSLRSCSARFPLAAPRIRPARASPLTAVNLGPTSLSRILLLPASDYPGWGRGDRGPLSRFSFFAETSLRLRPLGARAPGRGGARVLTR